MIEILWKAKIGYGDILSPLCYAYNESVRKQEDVNLVYLFEQSRNHRYKKEDSETLTDRILFLKAHTFQGDLSRNVSIDLDYNLQLPESFNHKNYFDSNTSLHNLRFSDTYRWQGTGDHVAMITSIRNKHPFIGKSAWKDPYQGRWCEQILKTPNAKLIHYETPIQEACEILSTAKYAVTYHGSAAWLCKWIGVPMIVVSGKPKWSQTVFPWAYTTGTLDLDTKSAANWSLQQIKNIEEQLGEYLSVRD